MERLIFIQRALVNVGFLRIPSYIETYFESAGDWERELRHQVGSKRFREIMRNFRKTRLAYSFNWSPLYSLNPSELSEVSSVINKNVEKYLGINLYTEPFLNDLAKTELGKYYYIGRRYDEHGKLLQVLLTFLERHSKSIYYIVQSIDHAIVEPGINLYLSGYCEIYDFMQNNYYTTLYMGRGIEKDKLKIGANRCRLLYNYIKPNAEEKNRFDVLEKKIIYN